MKDAWKPLGRLSKHCQNLNREFLSSELGGGNRDRTCDLLNANQMLSQLSYAPTGDSILKS